MTERRLIAGGPRTGKTYRARQLAAARGLTARSTDDLIGALDWSEASAEVARWMSEPGPWIIEGVAVPRAIRKWLAANPAPAKPADVVLWLQFPRVARSSAQMAMAKGVETVWLEVVHELVRRGVRIER